MIEPLISVVLPARNEERRIATALESLRAQTLREWELIVVDDGSTDGTAALVEGFGDERMRVLRRAALGLAPALNAGLEAARAAVIARHDADDTSAPERLERQLEFLTLHPSVAVCGTGWIEVGPDGEEVRPRVPFVAGRLNERMLERNLITHGTAAFRRDEVLGAGGYQGRFSLVEDYDLWLRLARSGRDLWNLDAQLAVRGMTGENVATAREREQRIVEIRVRANDLNERRRAGLPTRQAALRLADRVARLALPGFAKRAVRRRRGQAL